MAWEMLASLGLDIYSDWQSEQLSGDQAKMSIESIDKIRAAPQRAGSIRRTDR